MVHSLLNNTWQFAGFKTNAQAEAISLLLVDEKGKPRSFNDFKAEAQKIGTLYNENWLNTEYQHAINSSQSAAQWIDIQATKKELPLLQYDTAGDARVRASHAALNGITLPVDDPFWDTHSPPWEFGCRCGKRQLAGGKTTPSGKVAQQVEIAGTSKFKNIGKTGAAFPDTMPFFDVKEEVRKEITDTVSRISIDEIKSALNTLKNKK